MISLALAGTAGFAGQDCIFKTTNDESLQQAMQAFHDDLAALVHGPAGEGNFTEARKEAGALLKLRDGIMAAGLSGNQAKRCAEISSRAAELSGAIDKYVAQCKAGADKAALTTALDEMHNAYRNLNSSLTSLEDLFEAFHELLRPLWHDAYPGKDTAAIKAEIPKLKVRAKLIVITAEKSEPAKAAAAKKLLEAVTTLEDAAAANDDLSILEALRIMHDAYEHLAEG